ncbi:MAG TPA: O-antigen ligase family protein, partial [Verrucomicrobiae bacterium]|nr:O-antigen ligase family protein [Verrucomicrobiae bacterium]
FLLCITASVGWSLEPSETLLGESTSVSAMVLQLPLTIAAFALLRTGLSSTSRMLWALALGCIPGSLLTVFNGLAGVQWKEGDTGYFMGLLPPDIFSPMLVMSATFLLTQVILAPRRRNKVAAGIMLPILLLGIALAGIRSGWIAFLAASAFLFLQIRKPAIVLVLLMAGGIVAAIAFAAQDKLPLSEQLAARLSEKSMRTGEIRVEYWEVAARGFLRRPILGIGWGAYPGFAADQSVGREAVTHNVFLRILCELGLVGFGAFWLWIVTTARRSAHTAHGVLISSLMVATLTQGCFLDHFICSYFWLFLGICDGTRAYTPARLLAQGEILENGLEDQHISLAT